MVNSQATKGWCAGRSHNPASIGAPGLKPAGSWCRCVAIECRPSLSPLRGDGLDTLLSGRPTTSARGRESAMPYAVDFNDVSTVGLESSPVATELAGLRAHATAFRVESIRIAYVFYESGLSINVMYTIDDAKKRAVGSSSPRDWKSPPSSPRGSNSRDRPPPKQQIRAFRVTARGPYLSRRLVAAFRRARRPDRSMRS
jgi:hypothetical protein